MATKRFRWLRTALAAGAAILLCVSCGPKTLSYDELRERYFNELTGQGADLNDPVVVKRLEAMDAGVKQSWESLNKAADRQYLWNDRDAQDDSISPFRPASITTAIGRLSGMAVAWATPGSAYYHNDSLKTDVIDGMEWMYANKWSPKYPLYGNWWDWIIGMPYSVNNMLVAMYDEFTPQQRANYIEALDFYAPDVTYEGASTGANKIWQCYSMALRGILARDPAKIEMGIKGIDTEFKYVDTHDGFYRDGSFLQHQWHPYTGGYGAGMLSDMVRVIQLVDGSQWAVDPSHVQLMGEWVENSYLPLIYQGAMMDLVRGREIARQAASDRSTGHRILLSAYNVARLSPQEVKDRILPRVKYEILSDTYRDFLTNDVPTWQLDEVRAFLADDKIKAEAPAPYLQQFPMMDRVMYARPGFALALAMSSSRIENYESIDTENMMAWHTGDGVTYLYNGDQSQYTDHFWSTVDWYRLPGTTVDQKRHEVKSLVFGKGVLYADGYKSPHSWVGGSSIEGLYGISGMWFQDEKSTLQAKKSWFMAGDQVACLGTGVTSSDNLPVETIVDNRKLAGAAMVVTSDGKQLDRNGTLSLTNPAWVQLQTTVPGTAMGYYFPEKENVQILRESRTGSWRDFSKYGDPTKVTRDYVTMWVDHGKSPKGDTYAYVLLPGLSAEQTKAYAAQPGMTVLANTPAVQAARAEAEGVTGINFWEAGALSAAGVSVDAPASVTLREDETQLVVGLSDPTMLHEGEITLQIDKTVKGALGENPNVKVLSLSPLKLQVNVKDGMGATFAVAFEK